MAALAMVGRRQCLHDPNWLDSLAQLECFSLISDNLRRWEASHYAMHQICSLTLHHKYVMAHLMFLCTATMTCRVWPV